MSHRSPITDPLAGCLELRSRLASEAVAVPLPNGFRDAAAVGGRGAAPYSSVGDSVDVTGTVVIDREARPPFGAVIEVCVEDDVVDLDIPKSGDRICDATKQRRNVALVRSLSVRLREMEHRVLVSGLLGFGHVRHGNRLLPSPGCRSSCHARARPQAGPLTRSEGTSHCRTATGTAAAAGNGDVPTLGGMNQAARHELLVHLELQARTLAAQAALAQLDDSKTDSLLPEIRDQLVVISQTLDTLGV